MENTALFLIFLIGTFLGSFLGVVVDRTNRKQKFILGRSRCDNCRKELQPVELVPVLSFFFLGRRCRHCGHKLSFFYPAIEIATGALLVLVANYFFTSYSFSLAGIFGFFSLIYLASILIVIFFTDLKFGLIPFWAVFTGLISVMIFHFVYGSAYELSNYIFSALGSFAGFLVIFLITKGKGMGFGDVVFVLLMGFLLGYPKIIVGMYIAFVTGAIYALGLVIAGRKKLRGETLPFGPFLILGTVISFFWGSEIIDFALIYLLNA